MSSMGSKRITELEATIADLLLRVKQLEVSAAQNSHTPSPTPTLTTAPTATLPPTPAPTPPLTPTQTPTKRATANPMSAPYQKHPLPAKPLYKKPPPPQKPKDTILYDVNVPRPNGAEIVHLKYIQNLHAEGVPKEETCQRTMDKFPHLCTGGSDKSRQARVWNEVEMNTSRWAVQYI